MVVLLLTALLVSGCDSVRLVPAAEPTPVMTPIELRAAALETTGCGFASDRTGSAIVWDEGLVLTVAHLVVQADEIWVQTPSGRFQATVSDLDVKRDLALLAVPQVVATPIALASAGVGDTGQIVGGAASGDVAYSVKTVADLEIEEVLGAERSSRLGYELDATIASGDSGAGAFTNDDRLIGIVFAVDPTQETTWVTAANEIEDFIERLDQPHVCDPQISRMVRDS
jgi:S1-C subfamily serine protease